MNRIGTLLIGLFLTGILAGQDLDYAKSQVKLLSSSSFHGRGYVKNGEGIASTYIAHQFEKFGLKKFTRDFKQSYSFDVNTFPGAMKVEIEGKTLRPGYEFMADPASGSCDGTFDIVRVDSSVFKPEFNVRTFLKQNFTNKCILLDTLGWGKNELRNAFRDLLLQNRVNAAAILVVEDKSLIFSVRSFNNDFATVFIKRKCISPTTKRVNINIKSKLENHPANNVIGFLPGEVDTFVVISAHFDHLGHLGKKTYYPGASDNASGTAMTLDLIRQLTLNKSPHHFSYAFLLFSGEEAGLLGSRYFVENPLFPLSKIRIVLNLDMMGAGKDGVFIFNGATYPQEFARFDSINKSAQLGIDLKMKGLSRGSDHYSFHEKNVKALFINTGDKTLGYHVPSDTFETLPFTVYEKLFTLLYRYIQELK